MEVFHREQSCLFKFRNFRSLFQDLRSLLLSLLKIYMQAGDEGRQIRFYQRLLLASNPRCVKWEEEKTKSPGLPVVFLQRITNCKIELAIKRF